MQKSQELPRFAEEKLYAAWGTPLAAWVAEIRTLLKADPGLLSGLLSDPGNLSSSPLPGQAAIRKLLLSPGGSARQPGRATCSKASFAFCMGDRAC